MPRRRASPKVEGKSGRSKLAQAASAAGPYDGESNFPIDDLPPDDLPVRDIAEDQEEWRPAHSMAIRAADLAGRDLADPVHVPNTDSPEPRTTLSGSGQPTSSAALRPEPAVETSAPDPQPEADPSTLQAQYLLPGFGSGNSVEAQLDPGGKQAMRPRRPRGSTTKRALSFAQRPRSPALKGERDTLRRRTRWFRSKFGTDRRETAFARLGRLACGSVNLSRKTNGVPLPCCGSPRYTTFFSKSLRGP